MHKLVRLAIVGLFLGITALPAFAQDVEPWVCPDGFEGQTLNIYNWSTYIGEDTVADFEAACDVTVTYDVYASHGEMLTRLRQGNPGYDLAFPSDYIVELMIREELVQPIDLDNIPNFANLNPRWTDLDFDPGNQYSVPYTISSIGMAYDSTRVPVEVTSWLQMFNYAGNVAWLDDTRGMLSIALAMNGYDPNTTSEEEINTARDYLIDNSDNVVVIAADDGQALLQRGEVDFVVEYNGDIFQIISECLCDDFVYLIPEEGAVVTVDNIVLLQDAPNPELAQAFLDYILHPQVHADISNFTTYAVPNQVSIDLGLIDSVLLENPGVYPDDASLDRLFFLQDLPEAEELFNLAWEDVKINLSTD